MTILEGVARDGSTINEEETDHDVQYEPEFFVVPANGNCLL
jgi:hypothetical protein